VIVASDDQILLNCGTGIGVIAGRPAEKAAMISTRLPRVWQNLSLLALIARGVTILVASGDVADSPRCPDSLFVSHNCFLRVLSKTLSVENLGL
jgi:hypothetical protein